MFNSHPLYLIGFYIKWTISHWEESLIWLDVFMAERYYNKERFVIRTHAYSAHEVTIHSYWDISQAGISEKLSHQIYSFSPSFFASSSLCSLHNDERSSSYSSPTSVWPKGLPGIILGLWFSGFLPPVQNWNFVEQIGASLEMLPAVAK